MTFPNIYRRGWLASWSQARRRRRRAPVLRAAFPDLLQWDWDFQNPYKWNVWMSLDGGATYILIGDYWGYGDARQFAPDGGSELYYIVGVDAAGNEITGHSNIVRPDDAPAPPTLFTNLVSYWTLDELAGFPRVDSTSNGFNLLEWDYYDGSPSIGQTTGVLGNAALFTDGDGSNQGLVNYGFSGWTNGADFTVAGWLQFTASSYDSQSILNLGNNLWLMVRAFDGQLMLGLTTDLGNAQVESPLSSVSEGTWTHFTAVRQGGVLKLYLDAVLVASASLPGTVTTESFPDLHLGCAAWGYPLNGALDEIGLWQRALSAGEVGQLYNSGSGLGYEWF